MIRILVVWLALLLPSSVSNLAFASEQAEVIARWSQGTVTKDHFDSWLLARTGRLQQPSPALLGEYVLVQQLKNAAIDLGLRESPEAWVLREKRKHQIASKAIVHGVKQRVSVSQDDVEARLRENPKAYFRPKRYKLSTIFMALPAESQVAASVEARMQAVHQQLIDGADFGVLAREHSESPSYARGGRIGLFALHELPTDVAAVVETLAPGDVSPVIRHTGGLSIFRCEEIVAAYQPEPADQRQKITNALYREALRALESDLRAAVQSRAAAMTLSQRERDMLRADLEVESILERRELPWGDTLANFKQGRARWEVAEQRGLLEQDQWQAELRWLEDEVLAQLTLRHALRDVFKPASSEQLKARFESSQKRAKTSLEYELRGAHLERLDLANRHQMFEVARKIQAGLLPVDQAAQRYSLDASGEKGGYLGWFDIRRMVQTFGPGLGKQIRQLKVGETTGLLKVDSGYWIFELLAKRSPPPPSFDDVRATLEQEWRRDELARLETELLDEYVAKQALVIEHR